MQIKVKNSPGRNVLPGLCRAANAMPINHLKLKNTHFAGDYTYVKSVMKSQINFVFTDKIGRKYTREFNIIQENCHLSDHKLVELKLVLNMDIDITTPYSTIRK